MADKAWYQNSVLKGVAKSIPGVNIAAGYLDRNDIPSKIADPNFDLIPGVDNPYNNKSVNGQSTSQPVAATTNEQQKNSGPLTNDRNGNGTDDAAEFGQIDEQSDMLRKLLAEINQKRGQGFQSIDDSYEKGLDTANKDYSRVSEGYNTKQGDTVRGKENAIGKVDTNARTLGDSLRRMIGMASGSGSSAYQITAPDAVNRKASLDRNDVNETFGMNLRDIAKARKYSEEDYNGLLGDLQEQKKTAYGDFEREIGDQEIAANGELGDLARKRAALQGGGYGAIRAASQPYSAAIDAKKQALGGLFEKYRSPVKARAVATQDFNLRDFTIDRAAINGQGQQQNQSATAPYLKPFGEEEEQQNPLY